MTNSKRSRRIFLLSVFFLLATAIYSQASTVQMTFQTVAPEYNSDGSYYTFPYKFTIGDSPDLISLMCDDFRDDINFGESWSANVYHFADIVGGSGQMNPDGGGFIPNGERV